MQAIDPRRAEGRGQGWVVAEGPRADGRVAWFGSQVEHWAVVDVDAQRGQFAADGLADAPGQGRVAGRAQGHVAGERRGPLAQGGQLPTLLVGGDEQRRPPGGAGDVL